MTYAKLEDGTIVESPTFYIGEPLEVVTEDGKSPAPNGEHDLFLKDEEGNETHIRVISEDGVIVERENVEELSEEIKKVDSEVEEKVVMEAEELKEEVEMEEETIETEPLPGEKDSEMTALEEVGKKMEEMAYRIEELEKYIDKMKEDEDEEEEVDMEEDEEEVSPMNGAPLQMSSVSVKTNKTKKVVNSQNSFLNKLYS